MKIRFSVVAIAVLATALILSACDTNSTNQAANNDRKVSQQALATLQQAQPVPTFKWSQLRQNIIEIETAQANTTQTHAFFFNQGVIDPVDDCPSIGFPIPATDELTNPQAKMADHEVVLPQADTTGVFTGDTSGTYVMCIDAQGKAYANYWEGFVKVVSGPAKWDTVNHRVALLGPSSFNFTAGKK